MIFFYIIAGIATLLFVFIITAVISTKFGSGKDKEAARLATLLPNNKKKTKTSWGVKLYPKMNRIPLIGVLMRSVRRRLLLLDYGSERIVRDKSAKQTVYAIGVFVLFAASGQMLFHTLEGRLSVFLAGAYMVTVVFDIAVSKVEKQSLHEEVTGISFITDAFNSSGMVLNSLDDASDKSPSIAAMQIKRIRKVFGALDPSEEVINYYESAPNDFMKKLAGAVNTAMQFPDTNKGDSRFIKSLNNILEEIRMEITKRDKLDFKTSGFKFMAVSAVFAIEPLKAWTIKNMAETETYFNSRIGLYATVLIYIGIIVSMVGSTVAKNVSSGAKNLNEGPLLTRMLKSLFLRRMMDRLAPQDKTTLRSRKIAIKSENLFRAANSSLSVRQFYLRKCLYAAISFVIVLGVQFSGHIVERIVLLDKGAVNLNAVTSAEYIEKDRRVFESTLMQKYKDSKVSDEEFKQLVADGSGGRSYISAEQSAEDYAASVLAKLQKLKAEQLKWYDLIYAVIGGLVGYMVPNWFLQLRATMRKWEMQTEVDGFYSLLLDLTQSDRIMVYDLLEEMHRYSSIFSPQLLRAMTRYNKGAEIALERLQEETRFDPLDQIVERLKSCVTKVTVKAAFVSLEGNRKFSLEQRELNNEKTIEKRGAIASALGWTPIVVLGILYLGVPIVILLMGQTAGIGDILSSVSGG